MSLVKASTSSIQAVIFDLDGVLVNSERLFFQIFQALALKHGGELQDAAYSEMAGTSMDETIRYMMTHTGVQEDLAPYVPWLWQQAAEKLSEGRSSLPGAVTLIRSLAARGYPLAIASNSPADYIAGALTGMKVLDYFPVRVDIDAVAHPKPAPDIYLCAAQRLGVDPQRCLAVEDSRIGVKAADAAGMRVIAVPDAQADQTGFSGAWRIYPSLVQVTSDLDEILA